MLVPAVGNYTLSWADGVTDEGWSWFRFDRSIGWFRAPPSEEYEKLTHFRVTQVIPAKLSSRLSREPAVYALQTRFSLMEASTPERVSLTPGNRVMVGVVGERVAGVEKAGETMAVTFVRHRPALISEYLAVMGNYVLGSGTNWTSPTQYLLVNKAGEVLDRGVDGPVRTSRVAAVEITWETKAYRAMGPSIPNFSSKPRWEAIKALEEAELTRVTYRSLGSFTHEMKMDPFRAWRAN